MSERRLRGIVAFLHTEEYPETAARMDDALDALLAEHRAEVERLTFALKAKRTKVREQARNAALEEAEGEVDVLADEARESGRHDRAAALEVASERIRVLKSAPAAVLDAAKVREVLGELRAIVTKDTLAPWVVDEAERRLGLPLDAEGAVETCRKCDHPMGRHSSPQSGCVAPLAGGGVCPCSGFKPRDPSAGETCHLCPRPKHPGSSCYGGNEDGHRRDAVGCMADCPGCANPSELD